MQATKRAGGGLALCLRTGLLVFILTALAGASCPQTSSPAIQEQQAEPSQAQGESSSRKSHHIRVPVEDEQQQAPELKQAEASIDRKDYVTAESLLQKCAARQPANYVVWFDLGFVENALGNTNDSITAYRKSVAAKPDVFEANLNLGLQLAKIKDPQAEQYLRTATQLAPAGDVAQGRYRAWLALARTVEQSKPEEALAAYQQAIDLLPNEAEPHLCRGQLFERQNRFSDAEAEYQQALKLDPHSSDAMTGLADVYMRGRRFPQAEEFLRRLSLEQPASPAVHIQLGRVLAAQGKTDAGIEELQTGTKLDPHDEDALRELAQMYAAAGKNDLAEAEYRKLIAAHPTDAELHRILGETLLKEKRFPEAQQEFATAIKLKPDIGEAYGGLAFAAGENKDFALALRALDARAKFLPEIPVTYFMRASAYDHLHDFKKAAANYHLFLNTAQGKYPDEEWQAEHRLIAIEPRK